MAAYHRIVLKLSGEALAPKDKSACFQAERVNETADMLEGLVKSGVQTAVVIGGGNIWRGRFSKDMDPVNADQMGMLATVINALAVADALTRRGVLAVVYTASEMNRFARLYTRDAALETLDAGGVALLAGGSGNPFFTTDTAAALRAAELKADALFKGTTVEGVLDGDPRDKTKPYPKLIKDLTYQEAIDRGLGVMDMTAFLLCKERGVPKIRVFSMDDLNTIRRVAEGDDTGSLVHA